MWLVHCYLTLRLQRARAQLQALFLSRATFGIFLGTFSPQSFRLVPLTSEISVSPSVVCLPLPAESLGSWQAGSSLLGSYSSQVVQAFSYRILVQLLLWGRHLAPKKQERRMGAWMVGMQVSLNSAWVLLLRCFRPIQPSSFIFRLFKNKSDILLLVSQTPGSTCQALGVKPLSNGLVE